MADTGNARADPAANYRYTGQRPPNPRHLAIALQHANQIQAQKDAQALILDRILQLIEFPSSADSADPAHPSAEDATALKTALVPFQPADFDNLVLERNIEGRCGYALCPRENRKEDPKVKFRILWGPKGSADNGRGREMKVVPREKLEMWCSNQCAKRAMYLRVQLAEEPVWERRAVDARTKPLELLEEAHKPEPEQGQSIENRTLEQQLENLTVSDGPSSTVARDESARQLALERGDTSRTSGINSRVDVVIREKDIQQSQEIPPAPVTRTGDRSGGSIEGYVPQGVHEQLKHARESDSPNESIDVLDSI